MKKVLIPTKLDTVAAETLKAHGGYEVVQDHNTPLGEQVKAHADAYAVIVRSEKVPAEILEALPRLKMVIRAGAGYDNIDIKHARKRGVDAYMVDNASELQPGWLAGKQRVGLTAGADAEPPRWL